jgi:hypothetical protein
LKVIFTHVFSKNVAGTCSLRGDVFLSEARINIPRTNLSLDLDEEVKLLHSSVSGWAVLKETVCQYKPARSKGTFSGVIGYLSRNKQKCKKILITRK